MPKIVSKNRAAPRRRFAAMTAIAVLCALALWGPDATAAEEVGDGIRTIADLNGKRLGVIAGTMLDEAANATLDYTIIQYYDNNVQLVDALLAGEIDAVVDDEPVIRFMVASDARLRRLEENMQYDDYAFAMRHGSTGLNERVSDAIAEFKRDGTIAAMVEKWIEGADAERVMPELPAAEDGPVLRFGSSPVSAPFAYSGPGGELIGFDVELLERVSRRLGLRLEVTEMEFSSLIPSLLSGSVDIVGACMSVTEERKRIVGFTESYYRGGVAVMVRDKEGG